MATAKTPRRRNPATLTVAGEPVGEWAEVLATTREKGGDVKPFRVTADLVISPPTPDRARKMSAATLATQAAIAAAANAVRIGATQAEVDEMQKQIEDAEIVYTEGLIGEDTLPLVDAFFADKGNWEKQVFFEAVKKQFLQLPDADECPTCGRPVDEDAAGKELESSTSSSTTGTNSRATSQPSSTE
ncbi:MAG: hypothetical protein PGN30_10170 [Mycolicibacterium neoaurum]|uniref:hypothetical protein n=1 Tax=Mycolicibacterium neoaurum TaxID=1795 RepID=UPI002FFD2C0A